MKHVSLDSPPPDVKKNRLIDGYVIPANRNWLRNLAVADILDDTIDDLNQSYPAPREPLPEGLVIE